MLEQFTTVTNVVLLHIGNEIIQDDQIRRREGDHPPEDVVDPNDVLLTGILGINGDGGAGLDPDVAAVLLDPSVVLGDTLSLVHH